jgi:hypothetical protein
MRRRTNDYSAPRRARVSDAVLHDIAVRSDSGVATRPMLAVPDNR